MLVALLALFISLGGTGLAASHYLITSTKQIKPSVRAALHGSRGPQGPIGPVGPSGPRGTTGGEANVSSLEAHLTTLRDKLNEDTRQLQALCFAVELESISTAGETTKLADLVAKLDLEGCTGYFDNPI
jgi:hypothetical protein